ncbi:MAG TPA: cadherin-like beta sandwich domain-containing protein [Mobilitalea sp.]|nr:cadherin-like beta sandwich domain-containing protein [Mobilitalea sp.]
MKMRIKHYVSIFLLLFLAGSIISVKQCQAASAEVNINADSTEVTVGDNIFVYVTIDSDTMFGDFEANLTYDENILDYKSGASVITGGSGFLKISDLGVLDGDNTRKYTLKFEALQAGTCTIAFSDRAAVYDFSTGAEMSVSSNVLTLDVKAPATASTDAKLKSLQINPSKLSPAFDPGTYEYNTEVSSDTEQLIISALPDDEKATVSISGNDSLREGENKVIVSVLAESGDIIKYAINVNRKPAPTLMPTSTPAASPVTNQNTFEIITIDGEKYAVFSGKYKLVEPAADVEIPKGYTKGTLIISGVSVTAYLPVNNEESEFLLVYAENELGDSGFYRYDRVEKTMLRYVPDSVLMSGSSAGNSDNSSTKKYNSNLTKAAIVIALLSAFSGLLSFVVIRLMMKKNRHKRND